jgi:hypothetical protein
VSKFLRLERWIESANRRPKLWLTALVLLMAVQISPWLYPAVDGCLYLKTIREFLSVDKLSNFHCYVPPGYLPLIAPAFAFGDRPFLAVSILQWLMAIALIGGLYVWARRQFPATAVLFTVVVMVNISMWTYYRRPLKEVASMALLMWTVNLMHVLLEERRPTRIVALTAAVALLTAYMTLIRYASITVAVGFALAALLLARRQAFGWGRALLMSGVIGGAAAAALAGWLYFDKTYGGGALYWREVASVYSEESDPSVPAPQVASAVSASPQSASPQSPSPPTGSAAVLATAEPSVTTATGSDQGLTSARALRLLHGLLYRINDVGCVTIPGLWKSTLPAMPAVTIPMVIFFVWFGFIALGWRKLVRRKLDVLALTLPVYIVLYAHWVCDQPGGRFMLPMLPIITACAWYGIGSLIRYRMTVFGLLILAHLMQSTAYWLWIDAPRAYQGDRNWAMVDRLANEIRHRPGQVAIADSAQTECQGLWLELDWDYRLQRLKQTPEPLVTWIVAQTGDPPVKGFSVEHAEGVVQLLHRNSRTPAGSSANRMKEPSSTKFVGTP